MIPFPSPLSVGRLLHLCQSSLTQRFGVLARIPRRMPDYSRSLPQHRSVMGQNCLPGLKSAGARLEIRPDMLCSVSIRGWLFQTRNHAAESAIDYSPTVCWRRRPGRPGRALASHVVLALAFPAYSSRSAVEPLRH
jgi:hypothetical protein